MFEKKPFQFWQEIWIPVVVILLQLYSQELLEFWLDKLDCYVILSELFFQIYPSDKSAEGNVEEFRMVSKAIWFIQSQFFMNYYKNSERTLL